jgi:hypothetical protein
MPRQSANMLHGASARSRVGGRNTTGVLAPCNSFTTMAAMMWLLPKTLVAVHVDRRSIILSVNRHQDRFHVVSTHEAKATGTVQGEPVCRKGGIQGRKTLSKPSGLTALPHQLVGWYISAWHQSERLVDGSLSARAQSSQFRHLSTGCKRSPRSACSVL